MPAEQLTSLDDILDQASQPGYLQQPQPAPTGPFSRLSAKIARTYGQLSDRYGSTWAKVILTAGLAALPVPIPFSSLLAASPLLLGAELHRYLQPGSAPAAAVEVTPATGPTSPVQTSTLLGSPGDSHEDGPDRGRDSQAAGSLPAATAAPGAGPAAAPVRAADHNSAGPTGTPGSPPGPGIPLAPDLTPQVEHAVPGAEEMAARVAGSAVERGGSSGPVELGQQPQHLAEGGTVEPHLQVASLVQQHAGPAGLLLTQLRTHLRRAGITDRKEQDAAIATARQQGLVQGDAVLSLPRTAGQPRPPAPVAVQAPAPRAAPVSAPAPVGPEQIEHVLAAIRQHGGDYNLAPLLRVRQYLAAQGLTDRAQQDRAINAARKAGQVTGSALEGRHGVSPEELAAAIPGVGDSAGTGFLSLRLAQGGTVPHQAEGGMHAKGTSAERSVDLPLSGLSGRASHQPDLDVQRGLGTPDVHSVHPGQQGAGLSEPTPVSQLRPGRPDPVPERLHAPPGGPDGALTGDLNASPAAFTAQGTDTQPARVPEGSFVINRDSAQANPDLVEPLQAQTVPDQPGQVADFGSGQQPAELTPGEVVVPPEKAAAHPDVVRQVNAAHGKVEHLAGGGFGGRPAVPAVNPLSGFDAAGYLAGVGQQVYRGLNAATGGPGPVNVARMDVSAQTVNLQGAGKALGSALSKGATGTSEEGPAKKPDSVGRLGDQLARVLGSMRTAGGVFRDLSSSASTAFGAVSGRLSGIIAGGSPTLFRDLTGSARILGASLTSTLIVPVILVSKGLQTLAAQVEKLDPALKVTIGTWAAFGVGALGGAAALSRVAGVIGGLLPVVRSLGTVLLGTPWGLAAAGLGALAATNPEALRPLWDSLKGFGAAFRDLAGPGLQLANKLVVALAGAAEGMLVPALKVAIDTATALVDGLKNLGTWLGESNVKLAQVAVGALALASPFRLAVAGGIAVVGMLNQIHPKLGALAVGLGVATYATRTLWVAIGASPLGAFTTTVGLVSFALLEMGGAFKLIGERVEEASRKIEELQALLDKLQHGGQPSIKDIGSVLEADEKEAYATAKTEEERRTVLEKALQDRQDAKAELGFGALDKAGLERTRVGIAGVLGQAIPQQAIAEEAFKEAGIGSGRFERWSGADDARMRQRRSQLIKLLEAQGLKGPEVTRALSGLDTTTYGVQGTLGMMQRPVAALLGQETIGQEDMKRIMDSILKSPTHSAVGMEALKAALAGGIEPTRKGSTEKFPTPGATAASLLGNLFGSRPAQTTFGGVPPWLNPAGRYVQPGSGLSLIPGIRDLGQFFEQSKPAVERSGQGDRFDYARDFQQYGQPQRVSIEEFRNVTQNNALGLSNIEKKLTDMDSANVRFREDLLRNMGTIMRNLGRFFGPGL